jgi:hypothetical protein
MENQSLTPEQNARFSKADLLARIDQSRAELEKTLQGLSERQLTAPGPEIWSVKDHLAHMAVWELGIAELLQHRDRLAAMNVDPGTFRNKSEDEINDVIYQQQAGLTLEQVMAEFHENHRRMLEVIRSLSDEDLYRPYAFFIEDKRNAPQDPVINWIVGNTCEHFDLHNPWIKSLLQWLKTTS